MRLALVVLASQMLFLLSPTFAQERKADSVDLARMAMTFERVNSAGGQPAGSTNMKDVVDYNFFIGFVTGVAETAALLGQFCPPQGATYPQLWRVVAKYLRENPQHLHHLPSATSLVALKAAYPCQ